ncbi:MAG: hypothetical protein CM1200mP41_12990 [Gammaproteobacteria bacterium]|nr:MAG: hypothetical protein CM1200mP41_12990 [Gammaproteobacteria bacterium]
MSPVRGKPRPRWAWWGIKRKNWAPGPLAPDLTRERQPLEEFPLDSVTFVGVLVAFGGDPEVSFLQGTRADAEVKVGDYVGQDYGQIGDIDLDTGTMVINEVKLGVSGRWQQNEEILSLPGAAVD